MGSNYNFKNLVNEPPPEGGGSGRPPGNFLLTRQPSIYALTFDELQSTMGGIGKDFGSMNMDELLKNIWSAEELQAMGPAAGSAARDSVAPDGNLQRQGSLTLPRTLSQKTVDEVWRDMSKDFLSSGNGVASSIMPQRQQTLGEVTLEEFLVRAGVVREDTQLGGNSNPIGFFGDLSRAADNPGLGFNYQQQPGNNAGMMGGRMLDSSNHLSTESTNLPLNVNGVRNAQQQLLTAHTQQPQQTQKQHNQQQTQQQHNRRQQQSLLSKPTSSPYSSSTAMLSNASISSTGIKGGIVGLPDSTLNNAFVQSSTLQGGNMGMASLVAGGVATGSPSTSLDGLVKSNGDTSSVSPSPYAFNGGIRGRKSSGLEKVVERRQRRMIKNRESAARSRARKQAYTMELEAELAKLKEENQELRKKQAEIMEIQKNQELEMMKEQRGGKRWRLRRTKTGPW